MQQELYAKLVALYPCVKKNNMKCQSKMTHLPWKWTHAKQKTHSKRHPVHLAQHPLTPLKIKPRYVRFCNNSLLTQNHLRNLQLSMCSTL